MTRLTNEQLELIQNYLNRARRELNDIGFRLDVDTDMAAWVGLLRSAPQIAAVTTTFDPEFSYVHPGNCFWTKLIRENDGEIVGCVCGRLFETTDALDLIRSHRLFFDRKPILDYRPVPISAPLDAPILAGRVLYGGGWWMHPEVRGVGLTRYLPRVHRAIALRHFDVDWFFGLVPDTPNRQRMARQGQGVPNAFSCIDGYFPPRGRDGKYQLIYAHRGEMLRLIVKDTRARRRLTSPAPADAAVRTVRASSMAGRTCQSEPRP